MPLADLSTAEREIVKCCLRAAAEGPFLPDWEFSTLFGVERHEVKKLADSWPDLGEDEELVVLAINNTFNNLLGYPHDLGESWSEYIPVSPEELGRIYMKWKGRPVKDYFDGFM